MITEKSLRKLYINDKLSAMQISYQLGCSHNKVNYWISKYGIKKRSISNAVYVMKHPNGEPFCMQSIDTIEKSKLFGIGIGLYWGEGNKKNRYAIRLGNTDPKLIKTFIKFLVELFGVNVDELRFGLQIFTDINMQDAMDYWAKELEVNHKQFYKVHTTISGSIGTYKTKSEYGVMTVYYHNSHLRDILVGLLPR